jgi:ketosteroid isomerase-like protein
MRNRKPLVGAWPVFAGAFLATAVLIVTFLAMLTPPLIARAAAATPAMEKLTEAQAIDLEKKFEAAQVAGDAQTLGALMADNAVFVHASAQVQSKAEFVDSIVTGKLKIAGFQAPSRQVIVFEGGAIVQGSLEIQMMNTPPDGGVPVARTLRIYQSTLWTHTPAGWQILCSQGTLIPARGGR